MGWFSPVPVDRFFPHHSALKQIRGSGNVAASGTITAGCGGNFIALAELLTRGNHPVCEAEHCPIKQVRAIDLRTNHKLSQADLLRFIQNFLTVIFRHIFVIPVVHHVSFGETDNAIDFQRQKSLTPPNYN